MKRILLSYSGKSTALIPEDSFNKIKSFILGLLAKETEVTLHELLNKCEEINDLSEMGDNLPFFVLKVKQHLELQDIIKIKTGLGLDRQQIISLHKYKARHTALKRRIE